MGRMSLYHRTTLIHSSRVCPGTVGLPHITERVTGIRTRTPLNIEDIDAFTTLTECGAQRTTALNASDIDLLAKLIDQEIGRIRALPLNTETRASKEFYLRALDDIERLYNIRWDLRRLQEGK